MAGRNLYFSISTQDGLWGEPLSLFYHLLNEKAVPSVTNKA